MSDFAVKLVAVALGLGIAAWSPPSGAFGDPPTRGPVLRADPLIDARTTVAPSRIPGAGLGLFARERIGQGEVIGELGGQLVDGPDLDNPSAYLVGLDACAFMRLPPYRYIDAKEHGGNVSRANFAPSAINGRETKFQNARIEQLCQPPWVVYVAIADIEPGTEIWLSYGPHYHYEGFMYAPPVRDFFCGLLRIDCTTTYAFEP